MVKCVVFDFDGTLVDSNAIKREAFFDVARKWDPSDTVVADVFERCPAADRYAKCEKIAEELARKGLFLGDKSTKELGELLALNYTARCESSIARCPEMPGTSAALEVLAGMDLPLFVNSATPVEPLRRLLKLRQWDKIFCGVYGAEASKAVNLHEIAGKTGAAPAEIVHVGDQPDDQHGATTAGCHFVAMTAGRTDSLFNDCPLQVADLRELPALLNKLSRETS